MLPVCRASGVSPAARISVSNSKRNDSASCASCGSSSRSVSGSPFLNRITSCLIIDPRLVFRMCAGICARRLRARPLVVTSPAKSGGFATSSNRSVNRISDSQGTPRNAFRSSKKDADANWNEVSIAGMNSSRSSGSSIGSASSSGGVGFGTGFTAWTRPRL